jgi:rhomboid protease GluP
VFKRQTTGSVICTSCGTLVGVNDAVCYNCNRRNPGLWGFAPAFRRLGQDLGFVPIVVGGTITLYLLSLLLSGGGMQPMLAPSSEAIRMLGASGAYPVFVEGRWWTVLTAGWLHAGLLHIFFNVLWIRQLAPAVAELYGPGRMVIVYTVAGVMGFTFTSVAGYYLGPIIGHVPLIGRLLGGAGLSVGASAPIFGLLGALVHYGQRTGSRHVREAGLQYALMMGLFGLIFPGVDNQAHLGGFVGGYLAGWLLDPLKTERIDHLVAAAACLAITLVALVASVVTALPLLIN